MSEALFHYQKWHLDSHMLIYVTMKTFIKEKASQKTYQPTVRIQKIKYNSAKRMFKVINIING